VSAAAPTESAYARAVESAWARLRGRPVVLSPREFELVAGWRRAGVPLNVVLEVLDHEARRRGGNPRSLGAVAPAVREAALAVASGRTASARTPAWAASEAAPAIERWRRALAGAAHPPLSDLLEHVLGEAAAGASPHALDEALDRGLAQRAPDALVRAASEEARRSLEPFRARMDPTEHERAITRAIVDRLRRALDLPRAALSRGPGIG
jgi:hypothetical protein